MPTYSENSSEEKLSVRVTSLVIKAVFATLPERDQLVKVLKRRFAVQPKLLSSLTHSNVMEVMAKKLIKHNYIIVNKDVKSLNSLNKGSFKVAKEIAI